MRDEIEFHFFLQSRKCHGKSHLKMKIQEDKIGAKM